MYTWYFFFFPKQAVSLRHKLVWPFLAKQKVLGKVYRLCPVVLLSICVQTCILICRFQSRRNIQNFHRFTGKENYNEWTIIVWGTYMSGYKCQNPWKPWFYQDFWKFGSILIVLGVIKLRRCHSFSALIILVQSFLWEWD